MPPSSVVGKGLPTYLARLGESTGLKVVPWNTGIFKNKYPKVTSNPQDEPSSLMQNGSSLPRRREPRK